MSTKIRIGVMGCARVAQRSTIPAIKELSNKFELVVIASRTIEKAQALAAEFKCKAVEGYDQLINIPDLDAIYMPLPTGLHKQWIIKALRQGKHVYAEKSMAYCYADACEMVKLADEKKLALMEGYMFQYHSQHQLVLDSLNNGKIGEVRHFFSSFGFPQLDSTNFRYDEKLGGGALLDAAGYPVRAAHFVLGEGFKIKSATLFHNNEGTNIFGSAFMSNDKGVGASLAFGLNNFYQCRYEIWGEKGKIIAERAFTPRFDFSPKIIIETNKGSDIIQAKPDNHFIKAFVEFYNICNGKNIKKHYTQILEQSQSLELIRQYSKKV